MLRKSLLLATGFLLAANIASAQTTPGAAAAPPPDGAMMAGPPNALPAIPRGNHYVCHPARATNFRPLKASFVDQFGEIDVLVTGVTRLCAPATKRYNGRITEVVDKTEHLVCYSIRPNQVQRLPRVLTNNQFGPLTLDLAQPNEICLPSGKIPLR